MQKHIENAPIVHKTHSVQIVEDRAVIYSLLNSLLFLFLVVYVEAASQRRSPCLAPK